MKKILSILSILLIFNVSAQETAEVIALTDTLPKNWRLKALYGLNGTQSSFVNWNAGGRNNIAFLGFINANATYSKDKWKWESNLNLAFGGAYYFGKGTPDVFEKTDDKIDISTSLGHQLKDKWYLSLFSNFKTQAVNGYSQPDDIRISTFMAPGYVNVGLGIEYVPNEIFQITLSPTNAKFTFVKSQQLADFGAFGVKGAVFDETTGELITPGEQFRAEFGAYLSMKYNKEILKNINLVASLDLFSNYLDRPQNIDVNADVLFSFKVNNWFSASLNWTLIYDHDILIRDVNGDIGPRTQFKSVLGLGVSYTMKNFKD